MKKNRRLLALPGILSALFLALHAGEELSLAEKVFDSDLIVVLRLKAGSPSFELESVVAKTNVQVVQVLKPLAKVQMVELPSRIFLFSRGSACWEKARAKRNFAFIAFFKIGGSGELEQMAGVEFDRGHYCDLNPDFPLLIEAISAAVAWTVESRKGAAEPPLYPRQRVVLRKDDNPYATCLALDFLRRQRAEEVISAEWGGPGSRKEQKRTQELLDFFSRPVCRTP